MSIFGHLGFSPLFQNENFPEKSDSGFMDPYLPAKDQENIASGFRENCVTGGGTNGPPFHRTPIHQDRGPMNEQRGKVR